MVLARLKEWTERKARGWDGDVPPVTGLPSREESDRLLAQASRKCLRFWGDAVSEGPLRGRHEVPSASKRPSESRCVPCRFSFLALAFRMEKWIALMPSGTSCPMVD